MPIRYKVNILDELKARGYSTYRLRKDKVFGERTIQQLRDRNRLQLRLLIQCNELEELLHQPFQPAGLVLDPREGGAALLLVQIGVLQGVRIQKQRGQRRFELMGHAADEKTLPLRRLGEFLDVLLHRGRHSIEILRQCSSLVGGSHGCTLGVVALRNMGRRALQLLQRAQGAPHQQSDQQKAQPNANHANDDKLQSERADLIIDRRNVLNDIDYAVDSLKVVGLAQMLDGLMKKAPVGATIPKTPIKGWNKMRRKGGFFIFATNGCPVCASETSVADLLHLAYLKVDMDALARQSPEVSRQLLDFFDLSSLPQIVQVGKKGVIKRRYLSFSEHLLFLREKE